jgi:PA14 domain/Dolichyl-phosphate-mannose-protein mannosyltransferase
LPPSPPTPPRDFSGWAAPLLGAALGQAFLSRSGHPWTLFPGLLCYACAVFFLGRAGVPARGKSPSPRTEALLFFLILLLALAFRLYRIDSLPPGMHTDEGLIGQSALRILHGGWRPFLEVFDYPVPELALFYQMAGWFGLAGSSYFTFHLFFVLLSLAAFPFFYWVVRGWAGPGNALLSIFFLAVMRWNWVETRNGYPSLQVPFYLFGALAFWFYGLERGKPWSFYLSALWVGAGFYTYQAFKIVPLLMAACALYEHSRRRNMGWKPFVRYFLLVLVLTAPLLAVMARKGTLGHREAELFIGRRIAAEGSLKPLWDVWTGTALMFNRTGDPNPRHNIPGHRMLDDVTALFFILGIALSWKKRREPEGFYPLAGFLTLSLTGLLSTDPAQSNRLVSLTPFAAFFAATALRAAGSALKFRPFPRLPALLGAALLGAAACQNAFTYFVLQARNPECGAAFGLEQNDIGRSIAARWKASPGKERFFISPFYFYDPTVEFLAGPARTDVEKFNLRDWAAGKIRTDKDAQVYLGGQKPGVVEFLEAHFPGTAVEAYPPSGTALVYRCSIPKHSLASAKPWMKGLRGVYSASNSWSATPAAVRRDPLLDFSSIFDFPFTRPPPYRVRWTGTLVVPRTGAYRFRILTTDQGRLWLDGKEASLDKPLPLRKGPRAFRLDFGKDSGGSLALHLVWKKPGSQRWEVVPARAFGPVPPAGPVQAGQPSFPIRGTNRTP